MPVYYKLHQVQSATRTLAANAEGQTGSARYVYVSGAKLLGVIRPLMDKLGLILTQEVVGIKNEPITYMTRNGEKTEMFTTVQIRFTWVDVEDGSQIVNMFFANGMNGWDKGLGSALTYAERYYLMKTFHIATDEDDVDALVKDEAIKANQPAPKEADPVPAKMVMPDCPEEVWWKLVKMDVEGKRSKSGLSGFEYLLNKYNTDEAILTKFTNDVKAAREARVNQDFLDLDESKQNPKNKDKK